MKTNECMWQPMMYTSDQCSGVITCHPWLHGDSIPQIVWWNQWWKSMVHTQLIERWYTATISMISAPDTIYNIVLHCCRCTDGSLRWWYRFETILRIITMRWCDGHYQWWYMVELYLYTACTYIRNNEINQDDGACSILGTNFCPFIESAISWLYVNHFDFIPS